MKRSLFFYMLVAAAHFNTEDSATILEVHKLHQQNWTSQELELLIQIEQEALNQIADFIKLSYSTRQHVIVGGRRPKCYFVEAISTSRSTALNTWKCVGSYKRQEKQRHFQYSSRKRPKHHQQQRQRHHLQSSPGPH